MIKKIVAMSFCAAAFVGAMTAPALGGEVTGNGKPANGAANGNSPCAFSGQQDDPATGAKVQNYGHRADDHFWDGSSFPRGASMVILADGTVIGCNPHFGLPE